MLRTLLWQNQKGQDPDRDGQFSRFDYVNGSLENTFEDSSQTSVLAQMGIREHVCDLLEGGEQAFKQREGKYGFG